MGLVDTQKNLVLLHGLGEDESAWDAVRAALPRSVHVVTVDVLSVDGHAGASGFSLKGAADVTRQHLDQVGIKQAHLCGLSLGAMVALQLAIEEPQRVRSLTLAAGQVKPPRALMAVQRAVMRLIPAAVMARQGAAKETMLSVLRAISNVDFSERLGEVLAPTLVLCGQRDRPNLPAARALAAGISGAELRIIPGAGHQSHQDQPGAFAKLLLSFLARH